MITSELKIEFFAFLENISKKYGVEYYTQDNGDAIKGTLIDKGVVSYTQND